MKLITTLLLLLICYGSHAVSKEIKPAFMMKSKGLVSDFVLDGAELYVANDEGMVEIFDIQYREKVGEIILDPIETVFGWMPPKVLSVDRHQGKTLIVSTAKGGYRNVWLHDGKTLHAIIKQNKKLSIKEARFLDADHFVLGTLGYDMIGYTMEDNHMTYRQHLEESAFSDMVLSEDKKHMVTASESGMVKLIDPRTGQLIKSFIPQNLDNIYKLAFANGTILTAGQDRRVGVYPKGRDAYHIKSDFLVYSVGLSPSGQLGVYSSSEENDLQLFDTQSGRKLHTLRGQDSVPSTIKFFDENGFFSAGYGYTIYYWYLKE